MSVQQSLIALRVADASVLDELRNELPAASIHVNGMPASGEPGMWTVILESHELAPEELVDAAGRWISAGRCQLHALSDDERLELLAGNDPWATQARG